MATKKIALDAGHGSKTAGKQTPDGIKEWTLNDKVRDKVVSLLKDYDVEFVFPDKNEGSKDESLTSRRTMYVKADVDAAVSIHHNASSNKWASVTGVETYVDKSYTKKDLELAKAIQTRMVINTGLKNRGVKKANFTVIDQDKIPAVLVEGGFMNGNKDSYYIRSEDGIRAYAKAVAEGLIEFLKLEKKFKSYMVKVDNVKKGDTLNIRKEPNAKAKVTGKLEYDDPNIYTIVDEENGWGLLKSKAGWINLKYTKKV